MKILISFFIVSLIFCLSIIPSVSCDLSHEINWIPETGQVNVKLEYPDEAHQGEVVTYFVDLKWSTDMLVNECNVIFKYLRNDGLWIWLNETELLNEVQVTEGEKYNSSIEIEIPQDIKLSSFSMHVYLSIKTEKSPNTGYLEFITTNIVEKTRVELQHEINQLKTQLTDDSLITQEFNEYKQTHSYSNLEYDSLKSEYQALLSQNHEDSVPPQDIVFALVAIIAFFIVTTAYFARKTLTTTKREKLD